MLNCHNSLKNRYNLGNKNREVERQRQKNNEITMIIKNVKSAIGERLEKYFRKHVYVNISSNIFNQLHTQIKVISRLMSVKITVKSI